MSGEWFTGAGFGMFVHWDHASQQGLELSWPLVGGVFALSESQSVSVEQYLSSAPTFDPEAWDAKALARRAKEAGMTYAVLTAKHHAGYALWPTALSDFSIASSPTPRDIVGEFVDALRAEDLKVGLYFSLSDWHHPDYPAFTEDHKPYVFGASPPMPPEDQWDAYLEFMFGQLRELLSNYGRIDLVWFDGGWERPPQRWKPTELESMIRELQPDILINDRLPGVGDFTTPEQFVPAVAPTGRWETCMTMNESWGWNPEDTKWKSGRELIHTLCEVTGRGGNLLLNVSPMGDGALPPGQVERLDYVRRWAEANREAVIGTRPGLEPWQFYGPTTRRDDRVYLHLLMKPYDSVTVRGLPVRRIESVTELSSGTQLKFSRRTGILERLQPDPLGEIRIYVPGDLIDPDATVLALDIRPSL